MNIQHNNMSDHISTTQAAEIMGVSRVTIFNMIKDGRIKSAIKVGRNYIIPKDFQRDFIKDIAKKIVPILKKNGVARAGIFGSRACASEHKNSDLDLLYEFKKIRKYYPFELGRLKNILEDILDMKVDLVSYDYLHPSLKKKILKHNIEIL